MAFSTGSSTVSISSEINVTPLIDVLLVLLIIFMVIVPVTPRGLDSQILRPSVSEDRGEAPVSVRLLVKAAGAGVRSAGAGVRSAGASAEPVVYEIDGRVLQASAMETGLAASLGRRSNRSVFVAASPEVSYRVVAGIVGQAKAAGATAVALGRLGPRE